MTLRSASSLAGLLLLVLTAPAFAQPDAQPVADALRGLEAARRATDEVALLESNLARAQRGRDEARKKVAEEDAKLSGEDAELWKRTRANTKLTIGYESDAHRDLAYYETEVKRLNNRVYALKRAPKYELKELAKAENSAYRAFVRSAEARKREAKKWVPAELGRLKAENQVLRADARKKRQEAQRLEDLPESDPGIDYLRMRQAKSYRKSADESDDAAQTTAWKHQKVKQTEADFDQQLKTEKAKQAQRSQQRKKK